MPTLVIVGAQWGDEGKGRITDLLSRNAHMVIRFQGGANAGHTVVVDGKQYILHLIPSGIIHPDTTCVIGNGVALHLSTLFDEIDELKAEGIPVEDNLIISDRAQVTMPYHCILDQPKDAPKGARKLVTTNRGIRPTYVDKYGRVGVRICDLLSPDLLSEKVRMNIDQKAALIELPKPAEEWAQAIIAELSSYADRIRPMVGDATTLINDAIDAGKNVLFEGAQGTALDVDFGTYPYVTSSNTSAGGACVGTGVGPTKIDRVIAIAKAYPSRVGDERPFPTLMAPGLEEQVRNKGQEFGATTGRPRRCGWFDSVLARHTVRVNGLHSLVVTKLDVLDDLESVKVCSAYRCGGRDIFNFPADIALLERCEPVYEDMPGWRSRTSDARSFEDLPQAAQNYLNRISELSGAPISIISVGKSRNDAIMVDPSLESYDF